MLNSSLQLGKAAIKASINAIKKFAAEKAAQQAEKVSEKAVEKTVELLSSGEVVEKLTEVATSSTPPPEPAPIPDTSPAPVEPTLTPAPPTIFEPLAPQSLTLSRILPDGDNDSGKGWQCSKYAWYLATGERMNYASHPDYGPCHGADMVDYLIKTKGWKECEKKNGAIFSYNDVNFGHTGVVVDASRNLVNDANTFARPLAVETHVLDLDALGARYAEE